MDGTPLPFGAILPSVPLQTSDGSRAVVLLQGAHVVSWCPAGLGEQLYLSPKSKFQAGSAVRGGVPVIFPQFAERGPGVRHGFARTQVWQVVEQAVKQAVERLSGGERAQVVLQLDNTPETYALWPHPFTLRLTVWIQGPVLGMRLSVRNPGSAPFEFSSALHTYLAVPDLRRGRVTGLEGVAHWDSARSNAGQVHQAPLSGISGEIDRIYWQVPGALELAVDEPERGDGAGSGSSNQARTCARALRLEQQGFEDAVVWNPGPDKCARLSDMPTDGYLQMLCIEAAQVGRLVRLAPGGEWVGQQVLRVE